LALAHDFDFTFQIGSDCYVVLKRLMESGLRTMTIVVTQGITQRRAGIMLEEGLLAQQKSVAIYRKSTTNLLG